MNKYKFHIADGKVPKGSIEIGLLGKKNDKGKYKKVGTITLVKKAVNEKQSNTDDVNKLRMMLKNSNLSNDEFKRISEMIFNTKSNTGGKFNKFIIDDEIKLPNNYCVMPFKRVYDKCPKDCPNKPKKCDNKCGRETIYLTGISGSGKSQWIANYLKDYKEKYPKNKVYFFSDLISDALFDEFDPELVDIPDLLENPIKDIENFHDLFKNSVCIFDDTNAIRDKKTNLIVRNIRDSILETGRHYNCTLLCTSHIAAEGEATKYPIRESYQIVFFPRGNNQLDYLLEKYMTLPGYEIDRIADEDSRWYSYSQTTPKYILHKRGGYFPSRRRKVKSRK